VTRMSASRRTQVPHAPRADRLLDDHVLEHARGEGRGQDTRGFAFTRKAPGPGQYKMVRQSAQEAVPQPR